MAIFVAVLYFGLRVELPTVRRLNPSSPKSNICHLHLSIFIAKGKCRVLGNELNIDRKPSLL